MQICSTKGAIRDVVRDWKRNGETVGLVPTMGFLHEGHLSLVRRAKAECDRVVVSVFVNPTQFGPNEDLETYPRDEQRDLRLLEAEGVDAVFMPDVDEMYAGVGDTHVEVPGLSGILQGALRPGHFRGVATVVTKLFNIVGPDKAVFGEKDYQQLAMIRQMVNDLDMSVEVIGNPTVREPDGLAMSSRNVRLSPDHRAQAVALNRSLKAAQDCALSTSDLTEIDRVIRAALAKAPDAEVRSVDIRDAKTLAELSGNLVADAVVLLVVRFGPVVLIDQKVISPSHPAP
ncbi:pantoate--beta-alanine ligase [Roseibium sp. RKSG952]|uniref:pantoate--beta-alanine ligase n=1 Tax=Roseibium sp. RKSG952 TaxID=2529384 RepID=UPI0012BBE93E|nr:pantoate--beta-alanine ligase [Roseibium sp. RKSG952]MTI00327.1 pantoate--beta-alanine ligase [Roseibium sp. RKSG952]